MAIPHSRELGTGWQSDLSKVAQPGWELRHGSLNPACSATGWTIAGMLLIGSGLSFSGGDAPILVGTGRVPIHSALPVSG